MEKDEKKKAIKNTLAELAIVQGDLLMVMKSSLNLVEKDSAEYGDLLKMYNEADDLMDCFGKKLSEYMQHICNQEKLR